MKLVTRQYARKQTKWVINRFLRRKQIMNFHSLKKIIVYLVVRSANFMPLDLKNESVNVSENFTLLSRGFENCLKWKSAETWKFVALYLSFITSELMIFFSS